MAIVSFLITICFVNSGTVDTQTALLRTAVKSSRDYLVSFKASIFKKYIARKNKQNISDTSEIFNA